MNSKSVAVILLLIVLAVGGYLFYTSRQTPPSPTTQITQEEDREPSPEATGEAMIEPGPEASGSAMTVTLSSQSNSGESGTATISEVGGKAVVSITLTGAPATAQPAHLHVGSCKDLGDVKYGLTNVVNGTSETTLNVSMDELHDAFPLALNIHKSASQVNIYVACGDVK